MKILITGCNHSGTTLLAECLDLSSELSIIDEPRFIPGSLFKKLIIKCPIPNILFNKKRSKLMVILLDKLSRIWPYKIKGKVNYKIMDFDKIIFISRNREKNIESIINWTKLSRKQAIKDYDLALKIEKKLFYSNKKVLYITLKALTTNTEITLKRICNYLDIDYNKNMINKYKNGKYGYNKIITKK